MVLKRDKFLTKNDLISFGCGTITSLIPLVFTDYNKLLSVVGGVVTLGIFKSLKYSLYTQSKREHYISFFRVLNSQLRSLNINGVIVTFICLEGITGILNHYFEVPKWIYPIHLIIALPIWLGMYFINNCAKVKRMQITADSKDSFNGRIQILDDFNGIMTIYSVIPLKEEHKALLDLVCTSHVLSITQDLYRKNIFYINYSYGKEDRYRKLEKGTIDRLEQILIDKKDKPQYIGTQENEAELIHEFTSRINPKRMIREMVDIEHKLGIKKGYMSIDQDQGVYRFRIKKDVDRTYILDDVISRVKRPDNLELPLILGADYSNGSIIFDDLAKIKHLLIAGKTGSGKSCTFKGIIESLMYFNQNIAWYMLDFADSALVRYEDFNNVKYIESDSISVLTEVNEILEEYNNRKSMFRLNHVESIKDYNNLIPDNKIPYIILAIDEANGFKTEWNKKEFEPLEQKMKTILQRGRKYGIFTIQAVQQTNDNDYVKSWKTQFTRLAHLLEDYIDTQNVTTNKELQQLIPTLGTGEFYLLSETGATKIKGCLSDKEHDKLYSILKGAYQDVTKVEEINGTSQNQPRTAIEIRDKTACNN
jgi:hypothetical protein